MNARTRGNGLLFLTALIWGSSFVAQRAGMEHIGPFTFNGLRCLLGGAVLLPVAWWSIRRNGTLATRESRRALWHGGLACGGVLFVASTLQQSGIVYTPSGKAGFITALYILIVPLLNLFLGRRPRAALWGCVGLGVCGLYLLSAAEGWRSVGRGDWLLLGCAFFYAVHILVIARYAPRTDPVALSALQFLVTGAISLPCMFAWEEPSVAGLTAGVVPFLYSGIAACGVGYTLQIVAQRDTDPTVASLILCLESVFAVLTGMAVLQETVTSREWAGCALLLVAIAGAQLPWARTTEQTMAKTTA